MTVHIRNMTRTDLDHVGAVLFAAFNAEAEKCGYAPRMLQPQEGTSWAWAVMRHSPSEILVADVGNRVVGICCLNPRGIHGGIGPVAVDPSFQGEGIGRQLMKALLKKTEGLQSVRLFQEAFNPYSFSLYYSLDFTPVAELLDLFLDAAESKGTETCPNVSELTAKDIDAIYAYDIPRSGLDRGMDLIYYAKWGKIFIWRNCSEIRGFLACLPGSRSVQLGPLVAEGEEEAQQLFQHALGFFRGQPCQTRIMARDHSLASCLRESGFKLYCLDILMARGPWVPSPYVEAFGRFPEGV